MLTHQTKLVGMLNINFSIIIVSILAPSPKEIAKQRC